MIRLELASVKRVLQIANQACSQNSRKGGVDFSVPGGGGCV